MECAGMEYGFEGARCVGTLVRPLSRVLTVFKDGGEQRLAATLAELAAPVVSSWANDAEALTWVPARRTSLLRRGFDHAELLAREVCALSGMDPVSLLAATGRDQRRLDRGARLENASEGFAVREGARVPRGLVLLDDVFTTGATLDAAARVLRGGGAEQVRAFAMARKVRERRIREQAVGRRDSSRRL
jgi:predicted amidophosphoribosyltransferase